MVMDDLFAYDALGRPVATEYGILCARQNGKGEILLGYDLAHLFLFPREGGKHKTILHTSHETKTNEEAFRKLEAVIRSVPQLEERVAHIYTANGQEGITLKPLKGQKRGDRIRFIARSKNSGRGFTAANIIYDEAQEFSLQAYNAMSYTQTTIKDRQQLFAGTVPEDGVNDSEVFEGVRDRGRDLQNFPATGWAEWSPEGAEDPERAEEIDKADEHAWAQSNPSMGDLITPGTIAEQLERDTSPNAEAFGRERLSIWPARPPEEEVSPNDLDLKTWAQNAVPGIELGTSPALAVSLGRGGGYATISGASRTEDGRIVVKTLRTEAGTLWTPGGLMTLVEALEPSLVVLDEKNCAPIVTDLAQYGISYMPMNISEIAGAHGLFVESANAGQVVHADQDDLYQSIKHATTRRIGNAGDTWDQSEPHEPITQVQSVTLAHWAVKKHEATPVKARAIIRGIR